MKEGPGIHQTVSTSSHFTPSQKADEAVAADQAQQQTAMGADSQDEAPPLKKRRTGNAEAASHVSTKKTEIESLEDQHIKHCNRLADLQGKQEITFRLTEIQKFMNNPGSFDASTCGFEIKYVSSSGKVETLIPPEIGMSEDRKKLLISTLSSRIGKIKESFVDNGQDQVLGKAIEDEKNQAEYTARELREKAPNSKALHYKSPNSGQYEITADLSDWPPSSSFAPSASPSASPSMPPSTSPSKAEVDGHFVFEVKSPNRQSERNHHERPAAIPRTTYKPVDQQPETTREDGQSKHKFPPSLLADLTKARQQRDIDTDPTIIPAHTDTTQPLPRPAVPDMETESTPPRMDIRPDTLKVQGEPDAQMQESLPIPPGMNSSFKTAEPITSERKDQEESPVSPAPEESVVRPPAAPNTAGLATSLPATMQDSLSPQEVDMVVDTDVNERRPFDDSAVQRLTKANKPHKPNKVNNELAAPADKDIYAYDVNPKEIIEDDGLGRLHMRIEGAGANDYAHRFKLGLASQFDNYLNDNEKASLEDITDTQIFNILNNAFSLEEEQANIPIDFTIVLDINGTDWLVNRKHSGDIRTLYVPYGASKDSLEELQADNTDTNVATLLAQAMSEKDQPDPQDVEKARRQCAISKLPDRPDEPCFLILQGTGSDGLVETEELLAIVNAVEPPEEAEEEEIHNQFYKDLLDRLTGELNQKANGRIVALSF